MKRILVYSHDTFGMGNIRRMLALSEHLITTNGNLSVLLVTGSPVIHDLRLPNRLDYIKLPCLTRTSADVYSSKTLGADVEEVMRMRGDLLLATAVNYRPDLVLVDKKPCGVKNELAGTLEYLRRSGAKAALVLRDILDSPQSTIASWKAHRFAERIAAYYDQVLVLGMREIFDPCQEYEFPAAVARKVAFCGYLGKGGHGSSRSEIRRKLGITAEERLILVTPGGGEDGHPILKSYCQALPAIEGLGRVRSLIVTGPEMAKGQRESVSSSTAANPQVTCYEFVDNMMGYMQAADVVVCMGGYNTICEVLSARRRAVVIPRVEPVQEQWIRAQRMAHLGLFTTLHPHEMNGQTLYDAVAKELGTRNELPGPRLHLDALSNVAKWTEQLLSAVPVASCGTPSLRSLHAEAI